MYGFVSRANTRPEFWFYPSFSLRPSFWLLCTQASDEERFRARELLREFLEVWREEVVNEDAATSEIALQLGSIALQAPPPNMEL